MSERIRLDLALEARGLVQSRARARDAILRGTVKVNGAAARKPRAAPSTASRLVNGPTSWSSTRRIPRCPG